jgi:hypothetical protein
MVCRLLDYLRGGHAIPVGRAGRADGERGLRARGRPAASRCAGEPKDLKAAVSVVRQGPMAAGRAGNRKGWHCAVSICRRRFGFHRSLRLCRYGRLGAELAHLRLGGSSSRRHDLRSDEALQGAGEGRTWRDERKRDNGNEESGCQNCVLHVRAVQR